MSDFSHFIKAEKDGTLTPEDAKLLSEARKAGIIKEAAPPKKDPSMGEIAEDTVKSGGIGVVEGVLGTAAIPNMLEYAADSASEWAGYDLYPTDSYFAPSYDTMKKGVEKAVGQEFYEPKYTPGKFANTVGEFVGGAAFPGGGVGQVVKGGVKALVGSAAKKKAAIELAKMQAKSATTKGLGKVLGHRGLDAANAAIQTGKKTALKGASKIGVAATSGVASEAAGQATEGTNYEPVARVIGGIVGGFAPGAASRAITPVQAKGATLAGAKQFKKQFGVWPTPGNMSNSKVFRAMESTLENAPFSRSIHDDVQRAFTSKVLKTAGLAADKVDDAFKDPTRKKVVELVGERLQDLGRQFEQYRKNGKIALGGLTKKNSAELSELTKLIGNIDEVAAKRPELGDFMKRISGGYNLLTKDGSTGLTGTQYMDMRAALEEGRKLASSDGMRDAYSAALGIIDKMAENSMPAGAPLEGFKRLRREYRNAAIIDDAISRANAATKQGFITPEGLNSAVQKRMKGTRYTDEIKELVDDAMPFMQGYNDSGTAARVGTQAGIGEAGRAVTDAAVANPGQAGASVGGLGGLAASGGDPASGIVGAIAGYTAPGVAGQLQYHAQPWLRNQLMSDIAPYLSGPNVMIKGTPLPRPLGPAIAAGSDSHERTSKRQKEDVAKAMAEELRRFKREGR